MTEPRHSFNKDVFDACMKQADYFAGRWDSRRAFEWKFSVSLWTLLAIGSGFLAGKGHVPGWVVIVPILLHYRWLHGVWVANDFDKSMGRQFRERAQVILTGGSFVEPLSPERPKWYRLFKDWSMSFQLLCTALLAVVLVVLNRTPIPQQPLSH
jgi:hypothetical protein